MLSRLAGKVSRSDVNFVNRRFSQGEMKVVFILDKIISATTIAPVNKRDLDARENVSPIYFITRRDLVS